MGFERIVWDISWFYLGFLRIPRDLSNIHDDFIRIDGILMDSLAILMGSSMMAESCGIV